MLRQLKEGPALTHGKRSISTNRVIRYKGSHAVGKGLPLIKLHSKFCPTANRAHQNKPNDLAVSNERPRALVLAVASARAKTPACINAFRESERIATNDHNNTRNATELPRHVIKSAHTKSTATAK